MNEEEGKEDECDMFTSVEKDEQDQCLGLHKSIENTAGFIVSDAVRLAVPHELIIHKVTDNVVNVTKAVRQLHHRFKTRTNEYILEKGPEGPKRVPKISFRTRQLMFELEDGGFEWRLGMIYRAGRVEQLQRIARDQAFEVKV